MPKLTEIMMNKILFKMGFEIRKVVETSEVGCQTRNFSRKSTIGKGGGSSTTKSAFYIIFQV